MISYLDFDFRLIVSLSVKSHGLIYEQRIVHGRDEELLGGSQSLALWGPYVKGEPGLGQEPQEPYPGVLLGHEVVEEVRWR